MKFFFFKLIANLRLETEKMANSGEKKISAFFLTHENMIYFGYMHTPTSVSTPEDSAITFYLF